MDCILAIDQGTHASRALVLDAHGEILEDQQYPVALSRPQPGCVEQDAREILSSVQRCVEAVLGRLADRQRHAVRCCGISTQRSTVLAWRRDGTPVSPAINWQDTRGARQVEALEVHSTDIRRISGLPLSPHYGASKLHGLHSLHPDPKLCLGPLASFLVHRLSGGNVLAVDHSNAQRMQLFDIHTLNWSPPLCDWFDVPLQRLPPCRPVRSRYGMLGDSGIPITAVCGDQNAAWSGEGKPADDCALVNLGSGAFVLASQTGTTPVPGLLSSIAYSDAAQCHYLAEGTVNGAGNALQWLQSEHGVEDIESRLAAWLQEVADPPLFLNTVGGLGSPWWRQGPQPRFAAGNAAFSHAEMAAGVVESMLFLVQRNLECLRRQQTVRRLRVSGGLSQIDALCQKLANLSHCTVERAAHREASASGVAWLAAGCPERWSMPDGTQHFSPQADNALEARYQRFIEQLQRYLESHAHE